MDLSKKEKQEELQAIKESIIAHEQQIEIHEKMLKREKYLDELIKKDMS